MRKTLFRSDFYKNWRIFFKLAIHYYYFSKVVKVKIDCHIQILQFVIDYQKKISVDLEDKISGVTLEYLFIGSHLLSISAIG